MADDRPLAWGWLAAWLLWTGLLVRAVTMDRSALMATTYLAACAMAFRFGTDAERRWKK